MERPHSGPTALVIAVQPVPGKYDCGWQNGNIIEAPAERKCLTPISITLHLWTTSKERRRRITCIGWARQSHRMKHCCILVIAPNTALDLDILVSFSSKHYMKRGINTP